MRPTVLFGFFLLNRKSKKIRHILNRTLKGRMLLLLLLMLQNLGRNVVLYTLFMPYFFRWLWSEQRFSIIEKDDKKRVYFFVIVFQSWIDWFFCKRKPYRIGAKLLLISWKIIFSFKCSGIVHFLLGVCEASNQNLYYIVIELRWQRLHWRIQFTDFASVFSKLDQTSPYCTESLAVPSGRFEIFAQQITDKPGWHHERRIRASNDLFTFVYPFWMPTSKVGFTFLQTFEFLQTLICAKGSFWIEEQWCSINFVHYIQIAERIP